MTIEDLKANKSSVIRITTVKRIYWINKAYQTIESEPNWENVKRGNDIYKCYDTDEQLFNGAKRILKLK